MTAVSGSNPCQDYSLHDCDSVAECFSEQPGYFQCRCPKGFVDVSPDKRTPGRKCVRGLFRGPLSLSPKALAERNSMTSSIFNVVDSESISESGTVKGHITYLVRAGHPIPHPFGDGRPCGRVRLVDECSLGTHTCDPNADCVDTPDGYTCRCKAGWRDSSRDPLRSPGRICRKGGLTLSGTCWATVLSPLFYRWI
ncbi:unnamed protein product [Heligmosomoides polygyrus]|uniref:EGF-like domain-containing protein n=1 Tax=Heligmosomoides polygyrus TaxID=6339 RepID=A0A183FFJ7_HELPZ|nr:unnamed protein product [Heligmosomoides polygyrus]